MLVSELIEDGADARCLAVLREPVETSYSSDSVELFQDD